MPHVLRAISGSQAGAVYVLGERTLIGRASDCDIQILHEGMSRHHARISREPDGTLVVVDLSSDNGTLVEGEQVRRHVLVEGQVLRFMRACFVFELHQADAVTSAVFQRKVTSGDSLRQTVPHERELVASRARITEGLDGLAGEHMRSYSRPQAAAPAPSGARPGAASASGTPGRSNGAETRSRTKEYPALEGATDSASVRRPTPTTPPRGAGDLVGTYAEGRGRRDRITAMPASWLRATGTASTATRTDSNHGGHGGHGGHGWVRVPRPQVTECGMRPGATLGGLPRVDDLPSRATATMQPAMPGSPASTPPRTGITAEYGAIVDRPGSRPQRSPKPNQPVARDSELDVMTTVPSPRRVTKQAGSSTPTEEVPRVGDAPREPATIEDDELDARTRPRITHSRRWTLHAPTPIAYEDTLRIPWDEDPSRSDGPAVGSDREDPSRSSSKT